MSGCMYVSGGNVLFRNRGGRQFEEATDKVIKVYFHVPLKLYTFIILIDKFWYSIKTGSAEKIL